MQLEFPSSALGHSACLHTNTSQASPSQVPHTSVNSPPSCRSRELMDALECAALPVFPTRTAEDQHSLPEKGRPACSPESQSETSPPKNCQRWIQLCPFSWEGTKMGHRKQGRTCLPVELLLILHPHVLSKGVVILVGVPVDDHILADDAGAGTAATRVLHGCHADPKPATEEGTNAAQPSSPALHGPAPGEGGCTCTWRLQAACEITARNGITSTAAIARVPGTNPSPNVSPTKAKHQ